MRFRTSQIPKCALGPRIQVELAPQPNERLASRLRERDAIRGGVQA
jgi:hypothetical protein